MGRHTGWPIPVRLKHPSIPEERAGTEPRPCRSIRCQAAGRCSHRPLRKGSEATTAARDSGVSVSAVARDRWEARRKSFRCPSASDDPSAPFGRQLSLHKGALVLEERCPAGRGGPPTGRLRSGVSVLGPRSAAAAAPSPPKAVWLSGGRRGEKCKRKSQPGAGWLFACHWGGRLGRRAKRAHARRYPARMAPASQRYMADSNSQPR